MSDYLYFPNNFKDIKDHIQADMISCKIFFQLMVTVFKENLNLQLPLMFYSSIRFVFALHLFQNKLQRTGLEPCQRSVTNLSKFNVFSCMILQFRLKTVWKISKPYCMTLKAVARQLCLKRHSLYQNVGDELLEMGKKLKIKHSVSSPLYKVWGNFIEKLCMVPHFCRLFYMGPNEQVMQGESYWLRFQRSSPVSFSSH